MFKRLFQTLQEVTATKTPHEKLIDYLEKRGLKEKAESLKNGGTSLSLSGNKIGESGAKEIAEGLKTNTMLTTLSLSWNQIGDSGAKEIAEGLKTNTTLTTLDLSINQIGESGAKEIAELLKTNTTLTTLNLYSNKIGDSGAKEIAEWLKTNTTLTTLDLSYNKIGDSGAKEINKYLQRNKTIAEKKAESLNAAGDDLCGQEKYSEAIEKYKAAIAISKKPLYVTNKANAEKKYEKQQQALKPKQLITETNKNKFEDTKNLDKKTKVQDSTKSAQIITEEKQDIEQIIEKIINNLENSTTIKEADKYAIHNTIYEIYHRMQKLTDKTDIKNITQTIQELTAGKITKGKVSDLEEEINGIVEKQAQIEENIRIEKLNIFKEVITKLETTNIKDNAALQKQISKIVSNVETLKNTDNIEQATSSTKALVNSNKITRGVLIDLEEEIETMLLQEINEAGITICIVKEIIYNNLLLNHPELLKAALCKFSLQQIGELSKRLSPDLVQEAINNEDGDLIALAGFMSLGNSEA